MGDNSTFTITGIQAAYTAQGTREKPDQGMQTTIYNADRDLSDKRLQSVSNYRGIVIGSVTKHATLDINKGEPLFAYKRPVDKRYGVRNTRTPEVFSAFNGIKRGVNMLETENMFRFVGMAAGNVLYDKKGVSSNSQIVTKVAGYGVTVNTGSKGINIGDYITWRIHDEKEARNPPVRVKNESSTEKLTAILEPLSFEKISRLPYYALDLLLDSEQSNNIKYNHYTDGESLKQYNPTQEVALGLKRNAINNAIATLITCAQFGLIKINSEIEDYGVVLKTLVHNIGKASPDANTGKKLENDNTGTYDDAEKDLDFLMKLFNIDGKRGTDNTTSGFTEALIGRQNYGLIYKLDIRNAFSLTKLITADENLKSKVKKIESNNGKELLQIHYEAINSAKSRIIGRATTGGQPGQRIEYTLV